MDIKILGQQIKAARLEEGLSQEELASILGTNKGNISRIESGRQNLTFEFLQRIASALNRSVAEEIFVKK